MKIDLNDTNASEVAAALVRARRAVGSPAMGMVLTLVVVTDEAHSYDAMRAAATISSEHPARILAVIRRSGRGGPGLDAQVRIGNNSSGEAVVLRLRGELVRHAESVVLPLLLPDSPVVVWWPCDPPQDPSADPLGALAQRRLTDAAAARSTSRALLTVAEHYAAGDTDLAWTRLTTWRALLAAALDQVDADVTAGVVEAERGNPSATLLQAWLEDRLGVEVRLRSTSGPGVTAVRLTTPRGDVAVVRPRGSAATFVLPGEADRPVALHRRSLPELLAEDLRRLDEDDVYAATVRHLVAQRSAGTRSRGAAKRTAGTSPARKAPARKRSAKKTSTKKASTKKASTTRRAASPARQASKEPRR